MKMMDLWIYACTGLLNYMLDIIPFPLFWDVTEVLNLEFLMAILKLSAFIWGKPPQIDVALEFRGNTDGKWKRGHLLTTCNVLMEGL